MRILEKSGTVIIELSEREFKALLLILEKLLELYEEIEETTMNDRAGELVVSKAY